MIFKKLNISQKERNGTTCLHTFALQQGAHILRVHDVCQAVEVVELLQALISFLFLPKASSLNRFDF